MKPGSRPLRRWAGDAHGALHPLSAAEQYARRLNRTCLSDCTNVSFVQ